MLPLLLAVAHFCPCTGPFTSRQGFEVLDTIVNEGSTLVDVISIVPASTSEAAFATVFATIVSFARRPKTRVHVLSQSPAFNTQAKHTLSADISRSIVLFDDTTFFNLAQ